MGNLTIRVAAESFVRLREPNRECVVVEVIDEENPLHIYEITVRRRVTYEAVNLRGDTDKDDRHTASHAIEAG